jgi:peptide chain release factor subunit 1
MLNREETLGHKHLKEAAKRVEDLMQHSGAAFVVVGGHQEAIPEFVALLSQSTRSKVAGEFVIDTSTMTPAVIRDQTRKILEAHERDERLYLIAEVFERVAAGGLGAAGLEWCLLAVNEKAADLLLVQDEGRRPGRACDNCGWLGLGGVNCPFCGNPTREAADIVDEMETAVMLAGGRVVNVGPGTQLDRHTVAARLRFPVPRPEAELLT